MTARQLANELLKLPDLPVIISDEMMSHVVTSAVLGDACFFGGDDDDTVTKIMGWPVDRPCISLNY